MLTQQVIYFTVTAQIVNFATEVIVPYVKRKVFKAVEEVKSEKNGNGDVKQHDLPEETDFLVRVRNEAELDEYDVTVDYREMVIQFGKFNYYLAWSLEKEKYKLIVYRLFVTLLRRLATDSVLFPRKQLG